VAALERATHPARMRRIRSIFISDTHLGCKHARAEALATFLDAHRPEHLFLVGDFIDGWKLKKAWRWSPTDTRILRRVMELARTGTKVYYTPGNHDDFLREFLYDFGLVEVRREFIFRTADNRRLLVTHGDAFDRFEQGARWFTMLLSFAYDRILSVNRLTRKRQQPQSCRCKLGLSIKLLCKRFAMFVSNYQLRLVEHARARKCEGIVCGHIHKPEVRRTDGVTYINTGDWVEHCTALIEYQHGAMELLFLSPDESNDLLEVVQRLPVRFDSAAPEWTVPHDPSGGRSHDDEFGPWNDRANDDEILPTKVRAS
jgi:UDP-2,3-diacylglucosamine pyrophosphatase LpxH